MKRSLEEWFVHAYPVLLDIAAILALVLFFTT